MDCEVADTQQIRGKEGKHGRTEIQSVLRESQNQTD